MGFAPGGVLAIKINEGIVEDFKVKGNVKTKDKVILSSLKEQCQVNQSIYLNFGCAVEAFSFLGITEHNTRSIQSTGIIKNPNDDNELKSRICGRCIDVLLKENLIDINKVSFNEANMLFSLPKGAFSFDKITVSQIFFSWQFSGICSLLWVTYP